MPRLGLRRRRPPETPTEPPESAAAPEEAPPIEPFVPVEAAGFDAYDAAPAPLLREVEPPAVEERAPGPLPRPKLGRPRLGWSVRPDVLLLALALIAGGIAATLIVQDRLTIELDPRWPVGVLALAGVWMLLALLRGQVTAFLGGAALAGVGLALLMDVEEIAAFDESVLGVVLVTVGLGIVIRGLVMHPSSA